MCRHLKSSHNSYLSISASYIFLHRIFNSYRNIPIDLLMYLHRFDSRRMYYDYFEERYKFHRNQLFHARAKCLSLILYCITLIYRYTYLYIFRQYKWRAANDTIPLVIENMVRYTISTYKMRYTPMRILNLMPSGCTM